MSGSRKPEPGGSGAARRRPGATVEALRLRAELLEKTRSFFRARGVLEVETPLLGRGVAVEEHIDPFLCRSHAGETFYLRASPEAPMKRLLAAGSGPIFQIARAFRAGERGRWHNPEFTILEWYRPGFDHERLMDEVAEFAGELLGIDAERFERRTYAEVFEAATGIDPHRAGVSELAECARRLGVAPADAGAPEDKDGWLNLLLATVVEPALAACEAVFVCEYPATQAAFARVRPGDPPVAERFELYVRGVELANGYHELLDPAEQRRRFDEANRRRRAAGKEPLPPDELMLEALEEGMEEAAGVALGFDRLAALAAGADSIDHVIAFPIERV